MSRILLVEDHPLNRDMLARRLTRKGFTVTVAIDGIEGVRMATAMPPDLILMDISLPEVEELESIRRLKEEPSTRSIPIIALTAHAMNSDRERAMTAGCADYMSKPVQFEDLVRRIHSLICVHS